MNLITENGEGKYYLYRHIRLDTNEVFYVGMADKKNKDKPYNRAFDKQSRNGFWKSIVRKTEYKVEIVLESNSLDFINCKEVEFIQLYGRRSLGSGTLTNLTDGGEGTRGYIATPELCKRRSIIKLSNKEEVLERCKIIHDNRYTYDNFEYVNSNTKSVITCPVHGDFWQQPGQHLLGAGCLKCGRGRGALLRAKNKIEKHKNTIIERFQLVHGEEFDYSKVNYQNNKEHIVIICSKHGEFTQSPNAHLNGDKCPKCRYVKMALKNSKSVIVEGDNFSKVFISVRECAEYFNIPRSSAQNYIRFQRPYKSMSFKFYIDE